MAIPARARPCRMSVAMGWKSPTSIPCWCGTGGKHGKNRMESSEMRVFDLLAIPHHSPAFPTKVPSIFTTVTKSDVRCFLYKTAVGCQQRGARQRLYTAAEPGDVL